MDAPSLLCRAHSEALRTLSSAGCVEYNGLQAAARALRLSSPLAKRLMRLGHFCSWLRHAMEPKMDGLMREVREELRAREGQKVMDLWQGATSSDDDRRGPGNASTCSPTRDEKLLEAIDTKLDLVLCGMALGGFLVDDAVAVGTAGLDLADCASQGVSGGDGERLFGEDDNHTHDENDTANVMNDAGDDEGTSHKNTHPQVDSRDGGFEPQFGGAQSAGAQEHAGHSDNEQESYEADGGRRTTTTSCRPRVGRAPAPADRFVGTFLDEAAGRLKYPARAPHRGPPVLEGPLGHAGAQPLSMGSIAWPSFSYFWGGQSADIGGCRFSHATVLCYLCLSGGGTSGRAPCLQPSAAAVASFCCASSAASGVGPP